MRYCKRCLYPENHPWYLTLDEEGVCSGCRVHEEKDVLDWDERGNKLSRMFESYRRKSTGGYDCIIPVSGGGDSYFIVHTAKKVFGMHPLLVTYNHEYNTRIGIRNLANLLTVFDCDHIMYTLNPDLLKRLVRQSLRRCGSMYWHVMAGKLTFPVQVAVKFKIPLIVWGVNPWCDQVGMFSHLQEVEMTKKARKEHSLMSIDAEGMIEEGSGISRRDIQPFIYPFDEEIERVGVRGIYLGNYIRWDSKKQHELMISSYGYETAPQQRTFNTYEDVDCFHSAGVHDYIKFLKYGYGKASDHATREIRLKRMTREEGIEMVKKYDRRIPDDLKIFLEWLKMPEEEFNACIDTWRDRRAWRKDASGRWVLADPVENHVNDDGVDAVRLEKRERCDFIVTPSKEPGTVEDGYILMGRGYIDKYNYKAMDDNQDEISHDIDKIGAEIENARRTYADNYDGERFSLGGRELQYCKRCIMSSLKPGVVLDDEGICSACRSVERKKKIDWDARHKDLVDLCDTIRGTNGNGYDCLVPVSGGKDSLYQVWVMKTMYKMNVLAVCVVPHLQTREGIANLNNLVTSLNVDLIKVSLQPSVFRHLRRRTFLEMGDPNWVDHYSVFAGVARVAYMYQVPLVVWGEDIAVEFGGTAPNTMTASAEDLIRNDLIKGKTIEMMYDGVVSSKNAFFYKHPSKDELNKRQMCSIYLGYHHNWDGYKHYEAAKKLGFQGRRRGCLSGNLLDYDNIDEKQCEIHIWFKFLKFGFWRPTDQSCYHIWNGRLAREKAVEMVREKQYEFPKEYYREFLEFQGITEKEFWQTAERYRNRDIWHKHGNEWRLNTPLA